MSAESWGSTLVVCSIIIAIIMCIFIYATVYTQNIELDNITANIENAGFRVVQGRSDSPTVVEITKNLQEFIQIAKNINASTVYRLAPARFLVVANQTYGCEYTP